MGNHNVRLGSTLSFDSGREGDLITIAEKLNQSHRMGEFMGSIFRLAVENPDVLCRDKDNVEYGKAIAVLSSVGMTAIRADYFRKVNASVADMQEKVDAVYNMCFKMYTLSQMGKTIGLGDRANNMLSASFLLEKQLYELSKALGVSISVFESNKVADTNVKAQEILQYIIESYDGVIQEIDSAVKEKEGKNTVVADNSRELIEYRDKLEAANAEISRLVNELNSINNTPVSVDNKALEDMRAEYDTVVRKLKRANEEIDELEEENSRLRKKIKKLVSMEDDYDDKTDVADETVESNGVAAVTQVKKSGLEIDNGVGEIVDFGKNADLGALTTFFDMN